MRAVQNNLRNARVLSQANKKAPVGKLWNAAALLLALMLVLAAGAQAQTNYVYVNNQAATNTVSAYSVSAAGALTQVSGSPFSTGGVGANVTCYGLQRITISGANNFMFVANTGNQTISSFQINSKTGGLTLVAGSPFATGLTQDSCHGMSLAVSPDGLFLYASSNGQIKTFSISATGTLTAGTVTPNPFVPNAGMVISPNGQLLAVSNQSTVSMFSINTSTGALTGVPGSPFPKTGTGTLAGLDFSCAGDRLYGGEATGSPTQADAWSVSPTGVLTPIPGTPFHAAAGNNSNLVLLSPDNSLLFESNQFSNSINPFTVDPTTGSLLNVGKFGGTTSVHTPAGMATDFAGNFLFVADDSFGVATFRIGTGGVLTSLSDLAINRPGEIQDLVAYPPRSCTSADLTLSMTSANTAATPSAPIQYTLSITNNGPSTATATVSDTLPPTVRAGGATPIVNPAGITRANSVAGKVVNGVVTVTTTVPHQLFAGEAIAINSVPAPTSPDARTPGALFTDPGLTGAFTVATIINPTSFTYNQNGIPITQFPESQATPVQPIPGSDTSGGGTVNNGACFVTSGRGTCSTASFAGKPPIVASTGANRSSNVVTITTVVPHQFFAGQSVTITGVADTTFNGTFPIVSVPTPTTFTYNQTAGDSVSGGGSATVPANPAQLITFPTLAPQETRTASIIATPNASLANGTVISNTAIISNKSVVDPNPNDNSSTVNLTVSAQAGTALSVPTATGPYGGSATLTATLTSNNAPLAGKTIGFNFNQNNQVYNAVTDGSGIATVVVPLGLTAVGTHTAAFTVTFGGDASFGPSSALGNLIVTKAQLTVTADNQSRLYGDPNPALTYTITGFVNGDTIAVVSGTADCSTTATPTSPAGTYPISCTQGTLAATNYVFVFVDGTLTVNPAPLTVTADNASRAYGAPNPPFTGTITGLKNGDNITATYASAATPASPVGTYSIVPTLVDPNNLLGNYVVTINNGTLTVTQAVLIVTANNAARLYGDPNPLFTGTIVGLVNGDNITATYTTTATPASPVGNYPIVPALSDPTNKLGNYAVTINNGNLVISAAALTVTADNATRAYGDPNPVFTGTITGLKNGDNITATYSTTATATSPAGTYPIVPALVDPTGKLGNYTVTINNGTLTVTAATLTVTAANVSRLYGDPNPVFTGTITGLKNGDNITATYSSAATPASPVGTYAIVPALVDPNGAAVNYNVVLNNGVLTVTQTPLTVTVASVSRFYGDPNPVFTGSIVGIKNGDNITATFSTTATQASPTGTYPIVATLVDPANVLPNYSVTVNNGTLTVNPAPLSVTAASVSRLFGTPNPPLTGIITGIRNGDNITATYSTAAVATSPVGTYAIVPALVDPAGALVNYTVTVNNGILTVNTAPTANFVFVNNQTAANSISGYSVSVDGTLTALAGSPFATGGSSTSTACSAVDRITLSTGNNLLFVSNNGDLSISAFQINPANGALTAVAGSPFASSLTLDSCAGISLAATPDGRFLMASSNGQINTFSIAAGGGLSLVSSTPNAITPNASMKISANGRFLATADASSVAVFTINADGSLTPVSGSPFAKAGAGSLAGLDFSSTSGLLYGAETSATGTIADAWTVDANGILSAITGSPFTTADNNSGVVLLTPDNSLLFASNQGSNSVTSFSVAAGGSLTSLGSFGSASSLHVPAGLATDRSGTLLYVADDTFGVAVFRINGAGTLSQLGDVAIPGAAQVQGLVAYPPRTASTADVSVTQSASTASVVAGQSVTYTITVTNNGADPASVTATESLPSGLSVTSCSATGNGQCAAASNNQAVSFYQLQSGESQTATIVAQTSTTVADGSSLTATASISNNSAVDANAANNSSSATITVSQPATSVIAVAPASGTYSGSTTLSATLKDSKGNILSGKTVSFSLNGAAVSSAVTDATGLASVPASLAGIAAGTYPGAVTASFAGDVNATAVSGSADLTVNPAVLTVTAGNASRIYGDPNPTFAFTITGFVNGETQAVVSGTPSCTSADPTSNVGSFPIVCTVGTLAASNYTFTFVNGTLTVTPAALTVTTNNATRVYGDANPAFTGTITGLKNSDNITVAYSTTATAASAVGTYPITPSLVDPTSKLGNYTVNSSNGTLTVTTAALSVSAANATRAFGDPNPVFTGTLTGIKNNDNITATYSTPATPSSPVGTYAIVPALVDPTGKLGNYTVTSSNGTLTVVSALLTVSAANATRFYGDPNPTFTGTITGLKNGDNITASYGTTATATSAPGAYAIVPSLVDPNGAAANYTVVINNGVLSVNAAPLTVAANNATRSYGSANPVFTGTVTGLKNGDNITATYTTVADVTSNVGTYAITPVLSDPTNKLSNYAVTITNGTLTITTVPLTVTANNASRVYGDPNPTFTGTITGLLNGDNITATYSSADPNAAVGTYPIVPTLVDPNGKLVNYTVTSSNGTLTVTAAPLSVAAGSVSRVYGDPNPAFAGTITGLKNGDNITATYSTTATAASAPGTYPIAPALVDPAGKLSNYIVTSSNGTLTITTAPLTVTAASVSRLYGDPNPVFTGTITGLKNGDNITASYSSASDATSPVGTYAIVPALSDPTGKLPNYTVVISNGTLTVNPAPLTVTADNASRAYGSANPAFTGAITGVKNGDNITATYASAATAASNAGTYPIVPTLVDPTGKLSNYAVTPNNGTLTITPVPLTVTADNASRVYGDPNPTFTGTITGLLNGDNITATYSSADPSAAVGTYPIVPTLVDPNGKLVNYTVTSSNGTLTVTTAPLSVSAGNITRAYGDPNPAFGGTITGIKNGDNITATYSTTADATSPVGTYTIVPALVDPTGKLSNYTVSSSNGTLTVTAAPLTVTAANASRVYGDPNPAFTGTIAGLKNGDNITASYSSAADPTSPVGSYAIVPALSDPTAKLGNYAVTIVNGTLTITPAPLTAAATSFSRVYGDPNPVFTGTLSGLKNGDNITATFGNSTDATSPVGTYPIVPVFNDPNNKLGNYTVITSGILTITQAPLSVTAADASRLYGDPNPAFTGTITGIKNGDDITATYASIADPTSAVGTYAITPILVDPTGKLSNYSVTPTNGTLTVNPAPLTIQANDASRAVGAPNPTFTGTITGIKNNDGITASYSSPADATSPAGTYPIIPSADPNPALGNYQINLINGTLTIS